MRRLLLAAALALAVAPMAGAADASGKCARTPGSLYWEVCVDEHGCTVYLWSTMPPAACL